MIFGVWIFGLLQLTTNIFIFLILFHELCCLLSILQENEQDRRKAQACGVIPLNEKFIVSGKHRHGSQSSISRCRSAIRSAPVETNVLLQEKQLKLRGDMEKDIYKKLKTRRFVLTPAYDPAQLQATGMNTKFELIFKAVGWEDVWGINELGSKLLTAEFYAPWNPLIQKYHLDFSKKIFLSHGNSLVNF